MTTTSSSCALPNNNNDSLRRRRKNDFENAKVQCLGKRDKSFAGRIDPKAVEICAVINEREEYYTTSSCAGRCFLYKGGGIKASTNFKRYRINHGLISTSVRYFDLTTFESDPTGGCGDPIRTIGQYDQKQQQQQQQQTALIDDNNRNSNSNVVAAADTSAENSEFIDEQGDKASSTNDRDDDGTIWLRFEPFILHVACRSLSSASSLMAAARPAFKNVGLTTWNPKKKYLVAIWGDEGLEMPLCTPTGQGLYPGINNNNNISNKETEESTTNSTASWLAQLVNERHERNWDKIQRFVQSVRNMDPEPVDNDDDEMNYPEGTLTPADSDFSSKSVEASDSTTTSTISIPKRFDVIGDIAYLHSLPENCSEDQRKKIGETILGKNKSIKVVVVRKSTLCGTQRAPGSDGLMIIAGHMDRSPLITTHTEYGIKCVVDLNHCFFSPRMGQERIRICQQVARGEHVLVLFAGVGMEAFQIAGRTEASYVAAIELNDIAIQCMKRGHRMLQRNKGGVKCPGAAERLSIIHGDVLDVLNPKSTMNASDTTTTTTTASTTDTAAATSSTADIENISDQNDIDTATTTTTTTTSEPIKLQKDSFDRILAPRPKEGTMDGDLGTGDGGVTFLHALLPYLKQNGGECHWYDFAADHEFPECERTKQLLSRTCKEHGLNMEVLHVANAGSVAMRQLRICIDFRVFPIQN